jgi:hypothetical protein
MAKLALATRGVATVQQQRETRSILALRGHLEAERSWAACERQQLPAQSHMHRGDAAMTGGSAAQCVGLEQHMPRGPASIPPQQQHTHDGVHR